MTPNIGEIAPDFALDDSSGAHRTLNELLVAAPCVLIFYRGHW